MKLPLIGKLTLWRVVFLVIAALGLYSIISRLVLGLGASTNLTDRFPWGLWISFDVMVGVGLAAGGFTVAATVHVFNLKAYEPIARPAILTAFLGYMLVAVALVLDIGRPWAIWHPIIMWNPHSVMFEVAWCVMMYLTVLAIEFSPALLERLKLHRTLSLVHRGLLPFVVAGVLLSMMHQSSLGTLFVIAPERLHPLWYTPLLPVFFFITAVAAGLAMTIVESCLSYRAFGRQLEEPQLRGMARVIVVLLAVFAVWKLEDLAGRGNLRYVPQLSRESVLFWGEMGLGVVLPLILFSMRRLRQSRQGLFFAATLTVIGFIVGRLNVGITGMLESSGTDYFPSAREIMVTLALVAVGFAAFSWAVKHLPIFGSEHAAAPAPVQAAQSAASAHVPPQPRPVLSQIPSFSGVGLAGLWALLFVGYGLMMLAESRHAKAQPAPAAAAAATAVTSEADLPGPYQDGELRLPTDYVFKAAPKSPGPVTFSHENHIAATAPKCDTCHMGEFSMLAPGKMQSGEVTMQRLEKGELCGRCHDGKKAFGIKEGCDTCHSKP